MGTHQSPADELSGQFLTPWSSLLPGPLSTSTGYDQRNSPRETHEEGKGGEHADHGGAVARSDGRFVVGTGVEREARRKYNTRSLVLCINTYYYLLNINTYFLLSDPDPC